jgi:hypothetical protein
MKTLKEEIFEIQGELTGLQSSTQSLLKFAKENSNVSSELIKEVIGLNDEIQDKFELFDKITQNSVKEIKDELNELRYSFADLTDKVINSIAMASVLHYDGQLRQANAINNVGNSINKLGNDVIAGSMMKGLFNIVGATVLGGLIHDGLSNASNRIAKAIQNKEENSSRNEFIDYFDRNPEQLERLIKAIKGAFPDL